MASHWWYDSTDGAVVDSGPIPLPPGPNIPGLEKFLGDWHGPFATKQDALNYYNANKAANPSWAAPTGLLGNLGNAATSDVSGISGQILAPLTSWIGQSHIWLRAAEMIAGLLLIAMGSKVVLGVNVVTNPARAVRKFT